MAAGSDLLDDFFNTDVDEKVVSDLVGSLESQLAAAAHHHHHHHHPQQPHPGPPEVRSQALTNHVASPGVGAAASAGVQPETKIGITPEMPKTGEPGEQCGGRLGVTWMCRGALWAHRGCLRHASCHWWGVKSCFGVTCHLLVCFGGLAIFRVPVKFMGCLGVTLEVFSG